MEPAKPLPFSNVYPDATTYVDDLLHFVTDCDLFETLCGGVHVVDFLTQDPDHYNKILPEEWRTWLEGIPIMDFLDLLMREDLEQLPTSCQDGEQRRWRGLTAPPRSLLEYIRKIRTLSLDRSFVPSENVIPGHLGRRLALGMKPKKAHEVENFAAFVDDLIEEINNVGGHDLDHVVDFGSGQNYLGRVLASPLYQRRIIAVESKHGNISNARSLDINARLAEKIIIWRNKKAWTRTGIDNGEEVRREREKLSNGATAGRGDKQPLLEPADIRYVEHRIRNGDLSSVTERLRLDDDGTYDDLKTRRHAKSAPRNLLVVSLHSCGNLLHYGLRSLTMNPSVKAVAMVGCCYNLVTERLGPPTKKLPSLRIFKKRLIETSSIPDPDGFPMSQKLASYQHAGGEGIRMNITARMMAVQAPQNWTEVESDGFFTRHFFRALLQRIMMDRGFVRMSGAQDTVVPAAGTEANSATTPVTLGSLRKSCYSSFVAYVRGAEDKIKRDPKYATRWEEYMDDLTDENIIEYERRFLPRKHHLSIVWSLMAFSACVVEALIITDRWLYLKEQPQVGRAWVQSCFEYQQSPRNMVIIGVKR